MEKAAILRLRSRNKEFRDGPLKPSKVLRPVLQSKEMPLKRFLRLLRKKSKRWLFWETNRHHLVPRSRGGDDTPENILHINHVRHEAWHFLFQTLCLEEIIHVLYWLKENGIRFLKKLRPLLLITFGATEIEEILFRLHKLTNPTIRRSFVEQPDLSRYGIVW